MKRYLFKNLMITAAVAAIPAVGSAAPQSQAMNSCVSAFMQSLAMHNAPLKLRESRLINPGMTPGLAPAGGTELVMTATDAHDSHTVGRAVCHLDAHGRVRQLEEVPAGNLLPL